MTTDVQAGSDSGARRSFQSVLAVCGSDADDDDSLTLAAELARTSGAKVTLLTVVELPEDIESLSLAAGVAREEIKSRLVAEQREQVVKRAAETAPDLNAAIKVRVGKAFLEIIREAIDQKHDLVIKTAEELQGLHHHLFASTDQHLLRKCPCPVWLQRPGGRQSVNSIIAAVDVGELTSAEPDDQAAFNRRIIETALQIAAVEGAAVHVLHVWDAPGEGLVGLWSGMPGGKEAAKRYVSDVESVHWRALDKLVQQARSWLDPDAERKSELTARLERGAARTAIPAQAQALEADLLIMGSIARTGVPGFIIGNTAEDVLNSVGCSVVTVKPPGYVSPLEI